MTCPNCGARNPERAQWCSQCLTSLVPEEPEAAPAAEPEAAPKAAADPVAGPSEFVPEPMDAGALADTHGDRLVRTNEAGDVEWRCRQCSSWTSVDLMKCGTCGLGFGQDRHTDPDAMQPRVLGWTIGLTILAVVIGVTLFLMFSTG